MLTTPLGMSSMKRKGENGLKFKVEVGLRIFVFSCYGQDLNMFLG